MNDPALIVIAALLCVAILLSRSGRPPRSP
jgi:preprotein translocase subunit SecG